MDSSYVTAMTSGKPQANAANACYNGSNKISLTLCDLADILEPKPKLSTDDIF